MIYKKTELAENVFIEVYAPQKPASYKRDAILIIPGGGYGEICDDREGEPIALDFMQKGYACFVLHYSVGEKAKFPRPLIEASKAMKYIRDNAKEYNINPDRVFAMGFSAGGHLAASLGILWHLKEIYDEIDMPYGYNKPTGILPIYPVISANVPTHIWSFYRILGTEDLTKEDREKYSLEMYVDEKSSPAFICHTSTDQAVPVQNSLCLATAYANAGIPVELHIFKDAPHGIALGNEITKCGNEAWLCGGSWPELAKIWMKNI